MHRQPPANASLKYSEFIQAVESKQVEKVSIMADRTRAIIHKKNGERFEVNLDPNDTKLIDTLTKHDVDISVLP